MFRYVVMACFDLCRSNSFHAKTFFLEHWITLSSTICCLYLSPVSPHYLHHSNNVDTAFCPSAFGSLMLFCFSLLLPLPAIPFPFVPPLLTLFLLPSLPLVLSFSFLPSLPPEDLKIAMAAEANAWKVLYGRNMNTKYLNLMEEIMEQIEDMTKRLSRPIKDLDDIRQGMATLKEMREKEIYIDNCLGPVEVRKGLKQAC